MYKNKEKERVIMFDRKKVQKLKMTEAGYTSSDKSKNQLDYEKKVKKFLKYCRNFENALNGLGQKLGETITAKDIRTCFNKSFNEYYKKSKRFSLFSRTTKVLKEMDKKLKELGNLKVKWSDGSVAKLRDAFEYKRETSKNGYIKRSAIDDKAVYGFFNGTVPETIKGLRIVLKGEVEEIEFIKKSLENAKFENRLKVLEKKITEINGDLENINNERKYCTENEQAFEKNDDFIAEISKKVEEVNGKIGKSKENFNAAKEILREYRGDPEFDELECKKIINNIKNDVEQYSEEVKQLKLETEKAVNEFNRIVENEIFNSELFELKNEKLIINGEKGLDVYKASPLYNRDPLYGRNYCSAHATKVKTVIMNQVSDINDSSDINNSEIFYHFENLISVTAKSLKDVIGDSAFNGCEKLASFNKGNSYDYNISASVETICNYAFYQAGKKVSKGFSANVGAKDINSFVFAESGVNKINLPNINTIGPYAFSGCKKLKEVILGQNITADNIKDSAFKGCKNLSKVTLSKNISEDEIAKLKDKICKQAGKGEKTKRNSKGIMFIIK